MKSPLPTLHHKPEVIFLDAAGTLIQLAQPLGKTYAAFAARLGFHAEPTQFEDAFLGAWRRMPEREPEANGRPDDDKAWWFTIVSATLREVCSGSDEDDASFFFQDLYSHYAKPEAWRLFPEVVEVLSALQSRGYRLAVLSNFDTRLFSVLDGLDISHRMERIIVSSRVGAEKPHPAIFQSALRHMSVSPERALHVGDDLRADGEGAARSGIPSFLVDRPSRDLKDLLVLL